MSIVLIYYRHTMNHKIELREIVLEVERLINGMLYSDQRNQIGREELLTKLHLKRNNRNMFLFNTLSINCNIPGLIYTKHTRNIA